MRKMLVSVAATLAFVLSASAYAEVKKDDVAKVQYEIPAGMKVTTQGNMVAIEEDKKAEGAKEVAFFISTFDKADQQKAMGEMDTVLSSFLKDVKPAGDPAKDKLNGMDAVKVKATATFGGKPANVTMVILQPPGPKMLIIAGVVLTDKKDTWGPVAGKFIGSFKPL
jgi:hypothetical protein